MVNQILYEDNHIIVVNKLPGDIVQADVYQDKTLRESVQDYIKKKYNKPGRAFIGIVHRIDRPVSGAVMFARTSKALSRLNKIFRYREVRKIYWAVVDQAPPEPQGVLEHYLRKNESRNKSYVVDEDSRGAIFAKLEYKVLMESDRYYLLEVELHTGRHHQIRTQLAAIGCRIKGDLKYGFPRSNQDASIHLHARELEFIHPVRNEPVKIVAPVTDDPLWKYFEEQMSNQTSGT
ncbi:MAG: RluA family pseudouridine synthase [Bacteroidales bacterium]